MTGRRRRTGQSGSWARAGVLALAGVALIWPGLAASAQTDHGSSGLPGNAPMAAAWSISTTVGGVGGPAAATSVAMGFESSGTGPCGVAYGDGHLYVATGTAVRQVDPATDWLTTPVGTGTSGPLGDGGPADRASVVTCDAVIDHAGNLVIPDSGNYRVRVVAAATGTFYGQAMTAGDIYTVAGDGTGGYSGDGGPATR
jgi:hypothetical protein